MSLYKELWLAIVFLLILAFGGNLIVNSLSAKSYLERQLSMKNGDNANALALSLTQQGAEQVLLELTLSAQLDTGFYEMIQFSDPQGKVTISREDTGNITDAPDWFMKLLPIEVEPGIAAVQEGWNQVGTITLRSHSRFAYRELWQSTTRLALLFFIALLAAGSLGTYLLKIILRPLEEVVDQAEAIGNRRFISVPEPKTLEFKKVVGSMNTLSNRIRQMLDEEAKRLEKWQREAHIDKVTGLLQREPFMQMVDASLHSDDVNSTGSIGLIRMTGLIELNERYGRKAVDAMLRSMGDSLNAIVGARSRWAACRLNGSDVGLMAPREIEADVSLLQIQSAIWGALEEHDLESSVTLPGAATIFSHGETIAEVMTRLDGALQASATEGESTINVAHPDTMSARPLQEQMAAWQEVFTGAFAQNEFKLASYPVLGREKNLLHFEAPVRLQRDGEELSAGKFLPWINRLELSSKLDQQVLTMALDKIAKEGDQVAVNLSVGALVEEGFADWFRRLLNESQSPGEKLWFELGESMVFRHMKGFRDLCNIATEFGCKIGIEHMGHHLSQLGQLHDMGIDYLKIDPSFVRGVDDNPANQNLLRTLCTLGHSIGVLVIAEGVRTEAEWEILLELGADGATGPGITIDN
jgi:EAL domain-containing protein (putative c-di-GMP-specific phosphodiesterase class I)/GGDEF domain-containing protein